jgi:hypothetical protein
VVTEQRQPQRRSAAIVAGVVIATAAAPESAAAELSFDLGGSVPALHPFRDPDATSEGRPSESLPPFYPFYIGVAGVFPINQHCGVGFHLSESAVFGRAALEGASLRWDSAAARVQCEVPLFGPLVWNIALDAGHTWATYRVDGRLWVDVRSTSLALESPLTLSLSPHLGVRFVTRLAWISSPYDKQDWFNRPLQNTWVVAGGVGLVWNFDP